MYLPDRKRRILMRLITSAALLVIAVFAVLMNIDFVGAGGRDNTDQQDEFDGTHSWETLLDPPTSASDFITYTDFREDYCLLNTTVSACATAASGKYIRFDTANELYWFSQDVSYEDVYQSAIPAENEKLSVEKITFLLSLSYTLGGDIDYSVMGAKTFIPIGHWFTDVDSTLHKNIFTGTFDGRGFAIYNLYLAGYDDLIYVDYVDEITTVDIAVSHYYSMFTYNEGTIQNVGLINPTLELLDVHIDLNMTSNLVGFNQATGVVDHVFVVDNRASVTDAGIRYKVGTATGTFTAAGIVHTNEGSFTNSYYSSKVVVNGSYINKFIVQPVLYTNGGSGTYGNLAYDSSVYLLAVTVGTSTFYVATPNAYAVGETTSTIKSSSSSLNSATDRWYFYASDVYPQMLGLEWNDTLDEYEIADAIDLVAFSRVVEYVTINNSVSYPAADYQLTDDIDMSEVAPDAYVTPSSNFTGVLSGQNGTTLDDNFYIYNLHMVNGIVRETNYYAGLFSIVSGGTVTDLNIADSSLTIADSTSYYSNVFGIGFVAGRMIGGTMQNIQLDVSVDLGTGSIGETHLGMLVGRASGTIDQVSVRGTLDAGIHTFQSSLAIAPNYYIGGIVGSSLVNQITVSDSVNNAEILGFSTTSTFGMATGYYAIYVKMGGIIGYMVNSSSIRHRLINVSNKGDIDVRAVTSGNDTGGYASSQNVGGVFGELSGYAPILESGGAYLFANLYNIGVISAAYGGTRAPIRAAGIGTSNTSQSAEYALMFNHAGFTYDTTGYSGNSHFRYTGTILDVSTYNAANTITISRAYNYANFTLSTAYWVTFSPLYLSINNNHSVIRYSANSGDITYMNNAGATTITMGANLTVSGITASTNVNFQNVHSKGDITLVNINVGTYTLSLGGITATLTSGKKIVDSLHQGNIIFAQMTGSGNLYVGGLVAYNYSGDLQSQDASSQPIATIGIIDSINYGNITTTYSSSYHAVDGTSRTFVGGIAALNSGSIQDCANLGMIAAYNSNTSATTTFNTDADQYYAGRVETYNSGVAAAGIAAVTIAGTSRIYDIANNGDVFAIASKYARAGGVLAVSLYYEASVGGITVGLGLADTIQSSILSNGLNFGNVAAITDTTAAYSTTANTTAYAIRYGSGESYSSGANYSPNTTVGTNERPGIYASAGGVIGYGLCVMRRMINHGTISATDVAGGIVGATYVLGGSGSPVTVVNINTAINYGGIKSIATSSYASINKQDFSNIATYYQADGNTFIFPTGYTRESPRAKRGFGGIFGRLQRGTNGIMTSAGGSFDFIVNANPNIDLIGRLDQVYNFTSSARYFRFNDAIYYSAKTNDTTQCVFTGFYYAGIRLTAKTGPVGGIYTYTATVNTVYEQVGIVSSTYSTPGTTGVTFYSTSNYTVGTTIRYFYYNPDTFNLPKVPWITEDPAATTNDPVEYMYDAAFPMRSNPALTEYIYYMEYNLLADRFKTTGSNPRPNGMYVLSTTAGSTYGLVLPSNIRTDDIRGMNEDHDPPISLLEDYDNISTTHLAALDSAVLTSYNSLKQATFNDKHVLLEETTSSIVLDENGGSDTVLTVPTVNYDTRTITYTISMEAFAPSQTTVSYAITSIQTSAYALVAKRAYDQYGGTPTQVQLEAYNNLLYAERYAGISTAYPALLTLTLPSRSITSNTTLSLGYFGVFSEAFVGSDLFATTAYFLDYQVYIIFTPTIANSGGSIQINTVQFNGGGTVSVVSQTDVTALGNVDPGGSIRFNFTYSTGILATGYDFKDLVTIKYTDGTVVSSSYYTITSVPAAGGTYAITITFSTATRAGDYYMYYKYFSTSTELNVKFDKAPSTAAVISALDYYSEDGSTVIAGTDITGAANVGYDPQIGANGTTNFTSDTDPGVASYLDATTYLPDFMTTDSFVISPFATVTNVYLNQVTLTAGYKTFDLVYVITAEDGTTQTTYHHYITGREINLVSVLKNGNEVFLDDVFAVREDAMTTFTVDLGLDQILELYSVISGGTWSYFGITVTAVEMDGVTPIAEGDIVGLTYDTDDYLLIYMSYSTRPGIYTFSFVFYRDGQTTDYITISTPLVITKQPGTNSFLSDIRFSQLANETNYPIIRITDVSGTVLTDTGYTPLVYFNGIDYDGADEFPYYYYRVDGQVSNTPLDSYMPYFLDYLPYGGSVARYVYNPGTTSWYWTAEVTADSTPLEQSVLLADYTIDPLTGMEPVEGQDLMILYRVTAEDELTYSYYYTTVTDVTYNVTLLFDVYFCTGAGVETCTIAKQSVDFDDELVIITVKNFDTDGDDTVLNVTDPADYPTFSAIQGLNNQVTQFHFTYDGDYRYSFGRNISGFYVFSVALPEDQYLNDLYTYEIEFSYGLDEYMLNNASGYVAGLDGKYFYIEASTRNRTRRFNIYIRAVSTPETGAPWGLFDFFRSWWD
ncbi:MAG TPA: hypothetical protein DCR44_04130 [Acholeplasmatales bacterium]|nr:hypothetical protein [Acholeplasmatales bacterium]